MSEDDCARLLDACADMRREVDLENWSSTRRSRRLTLV
jgi:CAI-1 autoinducer synthase